MAEENPQNRITWRDWINIAMLAVILVTLFVAWFQLKGLVDQVGQEAKVGSANYVLQLSEYLDNPKYEKVRAAMEDVSSTPILKPFGQTTLEDYVGEFETIGDLVQDGVIDQHMAYDEFSYDVENAWCNKDVQSDIASARKDDGILSGPDSFFYGFEQLASSSLATDHKGCSDLDRE